MVEVLGFQKAKDAGMCMHARKCTNTHTHTYPYKLIISDKAVTDKQRNLRVTVCLKCLIKMLTQHAAAEKDR